MSRIIAAAAIKGAHKIAQQAEKILGEAIKQKGADCKVEFPNTGYYIPIIYSMTGRAVETLADFEKVMTEEIKPLLPKPVDDDLWLPYLGPALDAGMATLFAEEIIEACKYLIGPNPVDGIWLGAADDVILRERGIQFVDGSAPGFAAIVGSAPDVKTAVKIARKCQERSLYVFMAGHHNGTTFAEQLVEGGVDLGWDTRLVPLGGRLRQQYMPLVLPVGRPLPSAGSSRAITAATYSTIKTESLHLLSLLGRLPTNGTPLPLA